MPPKKKKRVSRKSGFAILAVVGVFSFLGIHSFTPQITAECIDCLACGRASAPAEQPFELQTCSYTRETRATALETENANSWNVATCWITAVGGKEIEAGQIGGALEIQNIEMWGTRNGVITRIPQQNDGRIEWCEHRERTGKWDTPFWKDFSKLDDAICKERTLFFLASDEILHLGTQPVDASSFENVQCIVTAKTSGGVRYEVGVDFREEVDSSPWPAVEGGFSSWYRCDAENGIRVASAIQSNNGTSECALPEIIK
ncbi:MAG: hypothetical protein NUV81_00110 [bacterium]|nr:hypothetical protein [bacterium]